MRYAELSCTEFYSFYMQQWHLIELFFYSTTSHGQIIHMNEDCPSFCSEVFLELAPYFFLELHIGGPCGVVYDTARIFKNYVPHPKWGK